MKRDIEKLSKDEFDILVIGGGIHGITVAREAAKNGYKTALIEMNDFGHSTSFNSMKVIHGGLRYLQHGNLKRIRQSIRSRKIMQNVAPHLIKAVSFLVPTFGRGLKSKNIMRLALSVNDLISFNRNYNIAFQNRIPGGYVISREEILKLIPGINTEKFTGGAVWYEAVVQNTERMLLEFLYEANQYDFTAANYVVALEFINSDEDIIVSDSDHYFDGSFLHEKVMNKSEDTHGIIPVFIPPDKDPKWSFSLVEKGDVITAVGEKDKELAAKGALANIGGYYFSHGNVFVREVEEAIAENDLTGDEGKKEFYVAPIYQRLIKKNMKIVAAITPRVWGLDAGRRVHGPHRRNPERGRVRRADEQLHARLPVRLGSCRRARDLREQHRRGEGNRDVDRERGRRWDHVRQLREVPQRAGDSGPRAQPAPYAPDPSRLPELRRQPVHRVLRPGRTTGRAQDAHGRETLAAVRGGPAGRDRLSPHADGSRRTAEGATPCGEGPRMDAGALRARATLGLPVRFTLNQGLQSRS